MIIRDIKIYDGSFLHQRFAFKYFKEEVNPTGNIIAFRAPIQVEADWMIDQEDLLNKDFIYSEDAVNFIWEIPFLDPFAAVAYQRLFNRRIADILSRNFLMKPLDIDGDDIMMPGKGKLSVSIAYINKGAALGHTGININAGPKVPEIAYSTELNDKQVEDFMQQVIKVFYEMNHSIFVATAKVL